MKNTKYVQERCPASRERPVVQVEHARWRTAIASSSKRALAAVLPGIGFTGNAGQRSLQFPGSCPPTATAQLFAPQVGLYEHLEGCAVNPALEVVLLNNHPLPKERVFNPACGRDQVQRAALPTAASAQ